MKKNQINSTTKAQRVSDLIAWALVLLAFATLGSVLRELDQHTAEPQSRSELVRDCIAYGRKRTECEALFNLSNQRDQTDASY